MQIATPTAPTSEDDEEQCITMTLVPPELTTEQRSVQEASDEPAETPTQMLYDAVSACSNLHPDPVEPGDEDEEDESKHPFFQFGQEGAVGEVDGGLPPPVDGSSGWITADNMHEFFDEEGNGDGEGQVGEEGESAETKWRRTD